MSIRKGTWSPESARAGRPIDVAQYWGCSKSHVRNLIKSGELRAFRLGERLWRIPADAVVEYEQKQEQKLKEENGRWAGQEKFETSYSTRELAAHWGCSDQHIRNLIGSHALPHFRARRLIRIPASAVRQHEDCGEQP